MKLLSNLLNHFWKRWRSEYLNELRDSHRYASKKPSQSPVSEGDIVIIHDDSLPRGLWKLGKIQGLIIGRDRQVRAATVRVASRGNQYTQLTRPLQRLIPLEIRTPSMPDCETSVNDISDEEEHHAIVNDTSNNSDKDSERPKREAARRARKVWTAIRQSELI